MTKTKTSPLSALAGTLDRRFLLDVWKNGAVTIRPRKAAAGGGLPVFSTETEAQALQLQVHFCRLSRMDNATYFLNNFGGRLEDLPRVRAMFAAHYAKILARPSHD